MLGVLVYADSAARQPVQYWHGTNNTTGMCITLPVRHKLVLRTANNKKTSIYLFYFIWGRGDTQIARN